MINRRNPFYSDDNDYTTNSPSYYDDLARKQKLLQLLTEKIWDYDDEIKEYFKRWEENLATINEDVIVMMIEWADDGTLADIINNDILNRKAQIFVSKEEPSDLNQNVYWYQDVGESGLIGGGSTVNTNVKVSADEPEDERYNIWFDY